MAAPDWNAEITRYLNIGATPDAKLGPLLERLGSAVSLAYEARSGSAVDVMTTTEYYDGNNKRWLYLRGWPIANVSLVQLNGATLTVAGRYGQLTYPPPEVLVPGVALRDRDHIERTAGMVWYAGQRNIGVTYTYGWQKDPGLVQGLAKWAAQIFRDRDRLGVSSQSLQGQTVSFTREVPPDVQELLAPYYRGWIPNL